MQQPSLPPGQSLDRCATWTPNPPDMTKLMKRRGFLRAGLTAGAFLGTGGIGTAAWAEACDGVLGSVPPEQRSIQLFTMIPYLQASPEFTLQQLYNIGYRRVEHAVVTDADQLKAASDNAGPEGIWNSSGHQNVPHPFDEASFQSVLDFSATMEQRFIVRASFDGDEATWEAYAESLNQAGAMAKDAGFESVGHHNHTQEYTPFEGTDRRPIDVLLDICDPELTHMEMDLCWVWAAGVDPVEVLEAHPNRFRQFHVKDLDANSGQPTFPGLGVIDFNRIFETAARTQVIEEYIIEQDGASAAAFQSAQMGWDLLEAASFQCPAPDEAGGTGSASETDVSDGGSSAPDTSAEPTSTPTTGGGVITLAAAALGGAMALRNRRG